MHALNFWRNTLHGGRTSPNVHMACSLTTTNVGHIQVLHTTYNLVTTNGTSLSRMAGNPRKSDGQPSEAICEGTTRVGGQAHRKRRLIAHVEMKEALVALSELKGWQNLFAQCLNRRLASPHSDDPHSLKGTDCRRADDGREHT